MLYESDGAHHIAIRLRPEKGRVFFVQSEDKLQHRTYLSYCRIRTVTYDFRAIFMAGYGGVVLICGDRKRK